MIFPVLVSIVQTEAMPRLRGAAVCPRCVSILSESQRGRNASEHFSTVEMALCVVGA